MKRACLVVEPPYRNNRIFDAESPLNRDDCLAFFRHLKSEFRRHGVDMQTQDLCPPEKADYVLYNEIPTKVPRAADVSRSYALLFESELILPRNWNLEGHKYFKYIFTWHDGFVDNIKYFKMNFSGPAPGQMPRFSEREKFCTLIAGNKQVRHANELYSKRVEAIRWFEAQHPEEFEFYGMGWGLKSFKVPLISKILNRITFLRKIFSEQWPSYRGPVSDKHAVLRAHKFSICYENAQGIPGYITEKILDSLAAGCLPVYWGAPNIKEYMPADCFIDRTAFSSYEELYRFLKGMTEEEFNRRLECIRSYFSAPEHLEFMAEFNARRIVERVLDAENRR